MAQTRLDIFANFDDADFRRKANEDKRMIADLASAGSPIAPTVAIDQSAAGKKNVDTSGFLSSNNSLEIQKGILVELRNLSTYFIRGNGNQQLNQNSQTNQAKAQDKEIDKIKEKYKSLIGTAALSFELGKLAYDTGSVRIKMAEYQGDYFGSQIATNNRTKGALDSATSVLPLAGAIVGSIVPALGTMAGAAVGAALQGGIKAIVGGITENKNVHIEEQQLLSNSYNARLKLNDESLAMFGDNYFTGGDITKNTAKQNARIMKYMGVNFLKKSQNTGMDVDEFQSLANQFSSYGVSNSNDAGTLARASALARSYTGADVTDFLGLQSRLGNGGEGAIASMNAAYSASMASGLGKGQFGEFLNGLQSAVEDGISNGFIRSTEDVSKTMVMFSKLSGNDPTLQGEYGFKMLRQADSGLRNATNLSSTSHLLAFQALRGLNTGGKGVEYIPGQDALNTLAFMEGGLDQDKFTAISKRFSAQYGDDVMENVLAIKDLYGLNYNGAMKFYEMQKKAANDETVSSKDIEDLMANPEFQSDQKQMVNALNDIKINTSILGEGEFRNYLMGLAGIDDKYSNDRKAIERHGMDTASQKELNLLDYLQGQGASGTRAYSIIKAGLTSENSQVMEYTRNRIENNSFDMWEESSRSASIQELVDAIIKAFAEAKIELPYTGY